MSSKNVEMMKKLLEKKKEQQNDKLKHRPNKKVSSGATAKKNAKTGGAKKV